jgi:putative chitinase
MNRSAFFADLRRTLFAPALGYSQVTGTTALLDVWDRLPAEHTADLRWLAYVLATVFHETGARMIPVREIGYGRGKPYGVTDPVTHQVYYGRGPVQLTWRANYETMGRVLSLDLVHHPDLAMLPTNGAAIAIEGMTQGRFTGHSLRMYFNPATDDPVGARRIINGQDCAQLVAGYHVHMLAALREAAAPGSALGAPIS